MKLIIAGTRDLEINWYGVNVCVGLHGITGITEIVSGHSGTVDLSGEEFAKEYWKEDYPVQDGHTLPVKRFPYKSELGKAGGPVRNREMAEYADALLVIWTGCEKTSRGSKNMKETMIKLGKPVYEVVLRKHNI